VPSSFLVAAKGSRTDFHPTRWRLFFSHPRDFSSSDSLLAFLSAATSPGVTLHSHLWSLLRSYDEVYTLLVKDCEIVLSGHGKHGQGPKAQAPAVTMRGDMVKLVCQDAKIGQRPQ